LGGRLLLAVLEHRQVEEGEGEEALRWAMLEEGGDLPWEPLVAAAAVFRPLASEAVEVEEHQQAFRLARAEERTPRRLPEQAWMGTTPYP
jgi:hypothetical protein